MIEDSLAAWHSAGRRFDFAGHRVFFRDAAASAKAEAPAVLLVHGYPTASWDWHRIWPGLNRDYRLVAPDLIGFGFSDKPFPHDYRVGEQADLLEALMTHLGLNRVHLIAHDLGDTVVQELLAREQAGTRAVGAARLRSVCLLNGGIFPEVVRPRLIQRVMAGPLSAALLPLIDKRRVLKSLTAVFGEQTQPSARELDAFWTLISRDNGVRVMPRVLAYLGERRRHRDRWVGALQDCAVPMRFINGLLDPVSGVHMVERYRELIRRPDVVEIGSVGHFPQLEAPDAVLDACLALLARADSDPSSAAE